MTETTENDLLAAILDEVNGWHSGTDRQTGEFTAQEYAKHANVKPDRARDMLNDDVQAGRLAKRKGWHSSKVTFYYRIVK